VEEVREGELADEAENLGRAPELAVLARGELARVGGLVEVVGLDADAVEQLVGVGGHHDLSKKRTLLSYWSEKLKLFLSLRPKMKLFMFWPGMFDW